MEYYAAMKKNDLMLQTTTQMGLTDNIQCKKYVPFNSIYMKFQDRKTKVIEVRIVAPLRGY